MSKKVNQRNIRWEDLLAWLRGSVLENWGRSYTKRDLITYCDGMHLTFLFWTDFLPAMDCSPAGSMKRWFQTISLCNPVHIITTLKCAKELLLNTLREELITSYESFKRSLDVQMSSKCGAIIAPLKSLLTDWIEINDPSSFVAAYSCLCLPLRIPFRDVKTQEEEAVQRFRATQLRVSNVQYPDLSTLRACVEHALADFTFPTLMPWKHGSGAVGDVKGKGLYEKAWGPGPDARLRYVNAHFGFPDDWYTCGWETDRTCTFQAVPKDALKKRAITMEPSVLMWHQQGMMKVLDKYIHSHPYLSRRISLNDQTINQNLALAASRSGELATLDLTDASDSVSLRLVKELFRRTPIYHCLIGYRSDYVRMPDGSRELVHSYAGMGNALTFRLECIVFACIAETVIMEEGGIPRQSQYRVYGDDIIIETRYADAMIRKLKELGFIPNQEKSWFNGSNLTWCFRESCGMEAMNGRNISPLRIPRNFSGYATKGMSPSLLPQLVSLANAFLTKGNMNARSFLIKGLLEIFSLAFGDGDNQLHTLGRPSNYRLKSRMGPYQRMEYLQTFVEMSRAAEDMRPADYDHLQSVESILYYECLRLNELRRPADLPLDQLVASPPRAKRYRLRYR